MVDLVRAGGDPTALAESEPSAQALRNWASEADREGRRKTSRTLKLERDILSRATAWFARETGVLPSGSSGS